MERKTYNGHGKPREFKYHGTDTIASPEPLAVVTDWPTFSKERGLTGNTKFWAEPVAGGEPTSEGVTKGLRAQVDRLERELASMRAERDESVGRLTEELEAVTAKLEATEKLVPVEVPGEVVQTEGMVPMVSVPQEELDAVLDEMERAGKEAAREVARLKSARASSGDRRKLAFHSGVAKTLAYFLPKLEKVTGE